MNCTRLATLGLSLGALFASGCGSSGKSSNPIQPTQSSAASTATPPSSNASAPSSKPLTKARLIARADTICRRLNAKRASIVIRSEQDFPRLLPGLAAYERAAIAEMRKLTPPPSMANSWKSIVEGTQLDEEAVLARSRYAHADPAHPDAAGALALSAENRAQKTLDLAKSEGFKDCSHA